MENRKVCNRAHWPATLAWAFAMAGASKDAAPNRQDSVGAQESRSITGHPAREPAGRRARAIRAFLLTSCCVRSLRRAKSLPHGRPLAHARGQDHSGVVDADGLRQHQGRRGYKTVQVLHAAARHRNARRPILLLEAPTMSPGR